MKQGAMTMLNTEQESSGKTAVVMVGGKLSIDRAAELREIFAKALDESEQVVVEFGECKAMDLSFLQLICSAHRSAVQAGRTLKLGDTLPALWAETAETAGYFRLKGCDLDRDCSCLWIRR
jgi:anti-anti-sigma regulatory factor